MLAPGKLLSQISSKYFDEGPDLPSWLWELPMWELHPLLPGSSGIITSSVCFKKRKRVNKKEGQTQGEGRRLDFGW